ncbi:histidine kinase [Aquimarina sp. MMG016]|uniref:tetratricopeptide repeat-containing sensor histidine kinase n=1 Tax=Aquimarina sp. MMG016 TaxID=2822690 RepID=UPI001B3A1917|nr:histidine kinase [Aquimarina sp. MMG016]MBQ4819595.1 histidine kinase [Aquimarina sp. MMG016]
MKILLFLIPFLIFESVFSQQKKTVIFDPEKEYTQEYIDSIINFKIRPDVNEYKKMLESNPNLIGWSKYYYEKAFANFPKHIDSVLYYTDESISSYAEAAIQRPVDEKILISAYYYKGNAYLRLKDFQKAIEHYQNALELTKRHTYKGKAFIFNGIAHGHLGVGNDSLALEYYLKASKDAFFMKFPINKASLYTRIGYVYDEFEDTKLAKYYYKRALQVSDSSDYKNNIDALYGNLGQIARKEHQKDSVLYYFKKALQAHQQYGVSNALDADFALMYDCYIKIQEGQVQKAVDSLTAIKNKLNDFETISENDKDLMIMVTSTLGLAYEKLGDSSEYSKLLEETTDFLDKFHKQQSDKDLANLEVQYQTKEKEASIIQLEKNKAQQSTILKQQKIITYSLGGFLLLLSGLAILFWRQNKLKSQYEKENLEQRLLRSQMNPHFVYNALNSICNLVDKKSDNTIPYIHKLSSLFRLILTNSREELVSLQDEIIALQNYLELQSNFHHSFDFTIEVNDDIDTEELIIPPMLIQPFVENAIVHGLINTEVRGKIMINISKQEGDSLLHCKISDNGVGYTKSLALKASKGHRSFSGDIVRERLILLKKKFKVNTRFTIKEVEEGGTDIELYLPYVKD